MSYYTPTPQAITLPAILIPTLSSQPIRGVARIYPAVVHSLVAQNSDDVLVMILSHPQDEHKKYPPTTFVDISAT